MQIDFTGHVALVAGARGAIGRAVADRLEASGARVVRDGLPAGPLDLLVDADPALAAPGGDAFAALYAALDRCEAAAGLMTRCRIVTVGSIFGLSPSRREPTLSAASAALFAHTRARALHWAPRGVLWNAVAALTEARAHTPLRRAATADEVAQAVLFLLAPASSYVVGEVVRVDGGWSAAFARDF